MPNTVSMFQGTSFIINDALNSTFIKKHNALALILPEKGEASGFLNKANQQLVFDLKKSSTFEIDGCKIKLELPDECPSARFKLDYTSSDSSAKLKISRVMEKDGVHQKDKFKPFKIKAGDITPELKSSQQYPRHCNHSHKFSPAKEYMNFKLQKLNAGSKYYKNHPEITQLFSSQEYGQLQGKNIASDTIQAREFLRNPLPSLLDQAEKVITSLDQISTQNITRLHANASYIRLCEQSDTIKDLLISFIHESDNWTQISKVADTIAKLHGKHNYTKEVDRYIHLIFSESNLSKTHIPKFGVDYIQPKLSVLAKLPVLGEASNPTFKMRSNDPFTLEEKQKYIFPISENTQSILNNLTLNHVSEIKAAYANQNELGHISSIIRDIAAMDSPRDFRKNKTDATGAFICDANGRFLKEALIPEVKANALKRNCPQGIIDMMIDRYNCIQSEI